MPAFGQGGVLGYYWNKYADIDKWNPDLFISQTSTLIDRTGIRMYRDLEKRAQTLPDQNFRNAEMRTEYTEDM